MSDIPILQLGGNEEPPKYDLQSIKQEVETVDRTLALDAFSADERKAVLDFKDKIDISDPNVVMQYGAAAQNKVAEFSDNVLQSVRTKDLGDVGDSLTNLVTQLNDFDSTAEKKGFFGLFKNASREIDRMRAGYAKVEVNVDKIVRNLEEHQRVLMKDVSLLDNMYQKNLEYFKELSMYIVAGEQRLEEFRNKDIPAQRAKVEQGNNEMELQRLKDMGELANRFEKKLHDLKLSRMISIQMAPQIRLLQNNDTLLIERIQSSIVNSIPLWKNQMVIALGLANSKAALKAQTQITDMTNEMLKKNSELLKQGTVEVAQEAERGIVSVETLQQTNQNLIDTINSVAEIQKTGSQKRREAEQTLIQIENDLKQALINAM